MFSACLRQTMILLVAGLGALSLRAQNYLVVEVKGQTKVVQKIADSVMYIEEDGKLKPVSATRSGLMPAPEFLPAIVAVRDVSAHTSGLTLSGNTVNKEFRFQATLESLYRLEDVFCVLVLELKRGGKRICTQGVGELLPRTPREIFAGVDLEEELGEGKYQLHIFSQGREVLHSGQTQLFRDKILDRMVSKRIAGLKDAPPSPLIGPAPEYPKQLLKAKLKGEVELSLHVTRTGVVVDPVVERATDPAFGEAALAAVRMWRFLPRMKGGQPVETTVSVPFAFEPQADPGKN